MRIAIIDDDGIFQFITKRIIEKNAPGHELYRFDDGQKAFDYIKLNRALPQTLPELILLDINMPHLNGWQFLDALRGLEAASYQLTIYMVSSSADPTDYFKSQSYTELKGYLKKPLSAQRLIELLVHKV